MTTMRRWLNGISIATTVLAMGQHVLAADPPTKRVTPGVQTPGVSAVTDGQGNPIELKASVAQPSAPAQVQVVARGRAWWPYATPLTTQASSPKAVESLTEDEIVVNGATLLNVRDLEASLRDLPKELLIRPGTQLAEADGFYLVKIRGFSRTQAQIDELTRAGAVLGEYLNVNTYMAKIPSASFAAVKALPFVSFVGDYEPAFKISPRIGLEEVPVDEAIDGMTGQERPWVFEVVLHKGVYVNGVLNEMARLGLFPEENDIVSNDVMTVLRVRAVPDAVPAIALIPGVKWIAEKTYPKLLASSTNPAAIPMVLQNNGAYTTNTATGWKLWNAGIDGTGQIVTMMDSGLNTKMEHFAQDILNNGTVGASHRKVVGYDVYGSGDLCVLDTNGADGGHGAKTSQHAVGSISNMTVNPDVTHTPTGNFDNGVARGAKVYFQDIGTAAGSIGPPGDLGPSITAAIGKGSFVQNHSWGAANNSYDSSASNLDTALFNNPNMVVTVSAGNRGAGGINTLGSPSTAKNAICVGGNDVSSPSNLFIDCLWDGVGACSSSADLGSSRGPVFGAGRTKPDIMTYIYSSSLVGGESMASDLPSAMCQTDPTKTVYWNYANSSFEGGTSFAAPEVAGLAALVRDYFQKGFYPTGTATPANALTPSGALVKAVILASGEAMATTSFPTAFAINTRYSSDVGYGRANLPGALHIGATAPYIWVQNSDMLPESTTKSFFYSINGNGTPLRVMMVYYDAAGDALQKDADLKVTIGGNTYWGNNFSGSWSTTATTTRDHTNNTEGVFLDSAHGLPASGTVQVDVIGFNNPGGMPYSLVVSGDVASQAVTQVSMEQGVYTCNDTVKITVNDAAGSSPVSVTLVSKDSLLATIDTQIVSCTGSNGVFIGTIQAGSGIVVADGGSLTATYPGALAPATATVSCQVGATDSGFLINGGCDNFAGGTDTVTGPLFNGGTNEFYTKYMDAGEYSSYSFRFKNTTGVALTDATVNLSFSGPGASKMSVFNNPVHIGPAGVDGIVGGVFQVFTDPSASALTSVNLDFDITSPADGYTVPKRLTQTQLLQANDAVTRLDSCSTFNTSLGSWAESTKVTRGALATALNTWHWAGPTQATGSELRTDGACGSAVASNAAAMTGGALTTANFNNNADSFLFLNFQPALRGNGPSGQPYRYAWKWHSFYHASETLGNGGGVWGAFYNNAWNNAVAPTGDQLAAFPIAVAYYLQSSVFDYQGTWNWDAANGGIPDDPHFNPNTGGAPNQLIISFSNVTGQATPTTYFAYGHEHADIWFFSNPQTHGTHRDIALDNDRLVYDEFYAAGQAGASCGGGGQFGQVAFDLTNYTTCPSGTAVLSVVDANGVSGMQVTVSSPGTLDSEVVTLTGTAPYFSGNLTLSTNTGVGTNNGVLFVLPSEQITASYTDAAPVGSSVAVANTSCAGGNVVYLSKTQIIDNGDNDGIPDNNETVTIDITVKNNLATSLTNAKVTIFPASSNIDCISDPQALYGTIPSGASATNPGGDRFTFHVNLAVACANPADPPIGRFIVVITGDGVDGPQTLQSFTVNLDLDPTGLGGPYTYTQNFDSDPGWTTGVTPDDQGVPTCGPFGNDFHWCAACGNGNGGYGAWVGNAAFGTAGQNYDDTFNSSTLYSPSFVANGNVGLQFSVAYRTEPGFDGALVEYSLSGGTWTPLGFTTPPQSALGANDFCSPFAASQVMWNGTGTGTAWTTTDSAVVPAAVGQPIQFRWRLGGDSSVNGNGYGGLGVDNVSITNLKQTVTCEPTRNTGLPLTCPTAFCLANPGASCDDGNGCTTGDVCTAGSCIGTGGTAPAEAQGVSAAANKTTYSWAPVAAATRYDVVRGSLSAFPVGPGGGDETCFDNLAVASVVDATVPAPGTGFWYLSRGENSCGNGTYGTQGVNGSPGALRTSTTCP